MTVSASHQPANKVNASGETIEEIGTSEAAVPGEVIPEEATQLLETTFKTSSPTDLMIHVTFECSIITDVTAEGGPDAGPSTGEAEGRIRSWLTFDSADPDVNVVPIQTVSTNPQPHDPTEQGTDLDKVTFCNRAYKQDVTDAETEPDGTDTIRTYIRTKAANAFNWTYLNTGNGLHTLRLWADFVPGVHTTGSTSSGFVGNRMLLVEPTKMSNHEAVAPE